MGNKTEKSAVGKLMKVKNCIFNVNTLWLLWILKYDEVNKEMLSHLIAFLKHFSVFRGRGFQFSCI